MEDNFKNESDYKILLWRSDILSNIYESKEKYVKDKKFDTIDTVVSVNKIRENEVLFQSALLMNENGLNTPVSYTKHTFVQDTPITENITTNDTVVQ